MANLDAATTAPAWVKSSILDTETSDLQKNRTIAYKVTDYESATKAVQGLRASASVIDAAVEVCHRLVSMEPELTQYDSICGDGDCGVVMKKGATYVLKDLDAYRVEVNTHVKDTGSSESAVDLNTFFTRLATVLSASMGGTSGVLLELCFRAVASSFAAAASTSGVRDASTADWTVALRAGVTAISYYGGATAGMRTMLDAFLPAVEALEQGTSELLPFFLRDLLLPRLISLRCRLGCCRRGCQRWCGEGQDYGESGRSLQLREPRKDGRHS